MAQKEVLYLVDGTYIIFRAFHARGVPDMRTHEGIPSKATYLFTRLLLSILQGRSPKYLGVAFDLEGPTLRHEEYDRYVADHPEVAHEMEGYKATRPETPEDLIAQIPWCRRVCEAFGVPLLEVEGYEADDVLGTLATRAREKGLEVVIVTADKDLFQLVGEGVRVMNPHKDNLVMDAEVVEQEFGARPEQVVDVLALMGDASDNIPGVPGIGEKGAKELVRQFGSLEEILAGAERIQKKVQREALLNYPDRARLSRELARIRTDAPIPLDLEALEVGEPHRDKLRDLLAKLEFRSLLEKLAPGAASGGEGGAPSDAAQAASGTDYRAVLDEEEIGAWVEEAARSHEIAIGVETVSAGARGLRIAGISLARRPREAVYIPFGHDYLGAPVQPSLDRAGTLLSRLLEASPPAKVGHDLKRALLALGAEGLRMSGLAFDTMIAAYLLDPDRRGYGLDGVARDVLGRDRGPAPAEGGLHAVEIGRAAAHSGAGADLALQLAGVLGPRLAEEGLEEIFTTIEMPLIEVLADMEQAGVRIDEPYLREFSQELAREMERISREAYEIAGHPFNLDSPVQLRKVLFEEIGLKPVGRTAKTRAFSTRDEDLEALAGQNPLPGKVQEYRAVAKLRSTYAEALPKLIHPATGRVHTSFNQTGAASGRLSSSDPNLQNVPVRTELGRKIRRAFLPREGWRLICADYSQIELRVMAHISGDPAFLEAFESGDDIHRRTAAEVFGVPYEEVTADQRRMAKTVNFGVIYGMSDFRLSRELGIPRDQARKFISSYFSRYGHVRRYIDDTIAGAERTGEAHSLLGRVRRFPDVKSTNFNVRQQALRAAVNMTIQGTAADIMKKAMVALHRRLRAEGLESRMLIQVHDEIVIEAPPGEVRKARAAVREEMAGAYTLQVPLVVDVKEGDNWLDAV